MNVIRLIWTGAKWVFAIIGASALFATLPIVLVYVVGLLLGLIH